MIPIPFHAVMLGITALWILTRVLMCRKSDTFS